MRADSRRAGETAMSLASGQPAAERCILPAQARPRRHWPGGAGAPPAWSGPDHDMPASDHGA
jgi:hypothetical protein